MTMLGLGRRGSKESEEAKKGAGSRSYKGGTRDRLSLIEPDSLLEKTKEVEIDGRRHMRLFVIDQIRSELHVRSLDITPGQAHDIDLAVHLEPADIARVIRVLNNDITTLQAQMIHDEKSAGTSRR